MDKKRNPEEIDEKELLASIYAKKNPESTISVKENPMISKDTSPVKETSRHKRNAKGNYTEDFLGKNEKDKKRPCVYIDLELHEIVGVIVNVIASKMTVGEYIDMVLREHFNANKSEINALYRQDRGDLINF